MDPIRVGDSDEEFEDANVAVATVDNDDGRGDDRDDDEAAHDGAARVIVDIEDFVQDFQDDDDEDSDDDADQPDDNMPADNILSASQCATVTLFDGTVGPDAERFIDQVNRAMTAYGWTEAQAVAAAQQRMTGLAASWLQHNDRLGQVYDTWKGDDKLRAAVKNRFVAGKTLAASIGGLAELQQGQKATERVVEFVERLSAALDKKNFEATEAEKAQQVYRDSFEKELLKYVLHGLRADLKPRVIGVPQAPETLKEVIKVCMRAEEEQMSELHVQAATQEKQGEEVNSVHKGQQPQQRGGNRPRLQKNQCKFCKGFGHWGRECPAPGAPGPSSSSSSNKGRGGQSFRGQRGYNRGSFNRGRGGSFPYTSGRANSASGGPDLAQYNEFLEWKKRSSRQTQEVSTGQLELLPPAGYWGMESSGNEEGDRA